jgi:YegS/Rv2252/BmrU family lipid kinase
MSLHAEVIINPVSGQRAHGDAASSRRAAIEDAARRAGVHVTVHQTTHRGHATTLARAAASRAAALVVAWGGDGTVNEVAAGLAHSGTPMAIVPAGSGNGLARELLIPTSPGRALDVAFSGASRVVDLGELNGRYFVNVAGIGFDACVARAFNAIRSGGWGLPRYVRLALREARSYVPQAYRVTRDGETSDVRAYVIAVANSAQYGNGARIAPHARMDDGLLDMVIVDVAPVWRLVLESRRLFTGAVAGTRYVETTTLREAAIDSLEPMPMHVDGEPIEPATHALVRVHRDALRVVSAA